MARPPVRRGCTVHWARGPPPDPHSDAHRPDGEVPHRRGRASSGGIRFRWRRQRDLAVLARWEAPALHSPLHRAGSRHRQRGQGSAGPPVAADGRGCSMVRGHPGMAEQGTPSRCRGARCGRRGPSMGQRMVFLRIGDAGSMERLRPGGPLAGRLGWVSGPVDMLTLTLASGPSVLGGPRLVLIVTRDELGVETIRAHRIRRHVRDR